MTSTRSTLMGQAILLGISLLATFLSAGQLFAGPLAEKAVKFDALIAEQHIPRGLVVNLQPAGEGKSLRYRSSGDSTIWTGAYIASQVYRYRVASDTAALANIEKCLRAFIQLHDMAGRQGFIGRAYGTREELGNGADIMDGIGSYSHLCFKADTSRDQYTGIFMGCALAWPYLRDEELRNELRSMIGIVARNLMHNNLALKVEINGFSPSTFNLNPDYAYQDRITPEEWARVDDFPANVLAANVPYSDRLARIVSGFKPPAIRGGEALRALMMFQTASFITGDPQIEAFLSEELVGRRRLHQIASDTSQLLSDIYLGRNRKVVENRLIGTLTAVGKVIVQVVAMKAGIPDSLAIWAEPVTSLPVVGIACYITDRLLALLDFMRQPGSFRMFSSLATWVDAQAGTLRMLGVPRPAERLQKRAEELRLYSGSNLDEFSDTMRSYVGCNLSFFALLGLLDQSADNRLRETICSIVPRAFEPISDEGNSMYSFIAGAFTGRVYDDQLMAAARKTLLLYPENCINRHFDHREQFKPSPWPDRFGRHGRQSVEVIPIDQRAPHIFIWQEPPRLLETGADDQTRIAPVGYLLAYWFGRFHGLVADSD